MKQILMQDITFQASITHTLCTYIHNLNFYNEGDLFHLKNPPLHLHIIHGLERGYPVLKCVCNKHIITY